MIARVRTEACLAAFLAATLVASVAIARPIDDDAPGVSRVAGSRADSTSTLAAATDAAPSDSTVLVLPVRRSPSVLLLRASAPLAAAMAVPASVRESWGANGAGAPDASVAALGGAGGAAVSGDPATYLRRDPLDAAARGGAGGTYADPGADRLSVSGTKSFAVDMGARRDASLSQGLDLSLRGRIAGDVDLTATLSDRALPFEPDGATRELDDFDQISLAIRAPNGEATLGDFRLEGYPGEFARMQRELQGVRGGATIRGTRWDMTAASAKGERRSAEFRGLEGKQGPYVLQTRDASGGGDGGIVAGSETVWLDGLKLRRGADADYVMDYAAGSILFTVRRPIGAASRIAVDYEAAASAYKRQLYAAAARGGRANGAWYAAYLREGDDWKRPFGAELSSEDRRALAGAGDSTGAPLPSGVHDVGAGKGSYLWDESDPAAPRWVYVGAGYGDHEVEFTQVGAGRGAYADTVALDGIRFYRYRGPTLGSYAPGRAIAVPASNALVDMGGSARLGGALSLDAELARSTLDRNVLSSRNDGDNGGLAARAGVRLDPRPLRFFGRRAGSLRADLSYRTREESFASFDRIDPAFEGERWNQRSQAVGERRIEGALEYAAGSAGTLRGEWGHRRLADGSSATRRAAEAGLRGFLAGSARWDEARNEGATGRGSRTRLGLDLGHDRGVVQPRVGAGTERVNGADGDSLARRDSRFASGTIGIVPSAALRVRGGVAWRQDLESLPIATPAGGASPSLAGDASSGERSLRSLAFDGGATLRADAVTLDASLARRQSTGTIGRSHTDLAQMVMTGGRPGGVVTGEVRWDVSQVREPERLRSLVGVGAGLGSYDASGTLAPGGGYEFVSVVGAEGTRTRAAWQLRLDAYPARGAAARSPKRAAWRSLGASTLLRLESDSRLPLGRFERAFRFGDYLAPGSTVHGEWNGRQTVEYVPRGGAFDVRLEGGVRQERLGDLQNVTVARESRDATLRVRHALPAGFRLAERVTADRSRYESARSDAPDATRSLLRGRGAEFELSRQVGPQLNLSMIGRYRRDEDVVRGGSQATRSAGPALRAATAGRLRVDASALWGRTEREGAYVPPGSVVAPVLGNRLDYDLLSEWSIRDRLQLSFLWNGASIPGRAATYNSRLELRSSF